MANALIAIEERLYAGQGVVAGDVWRAWEVVSRTEETDDVARFRIRPADGSPPPPSAPASTSPYRSNSRTAPVRYASTA